MANSIKMELELDGKQALRALTAISKNVERTANNTEKFGSKMDRAISSFAGNLSALATIKFGQFIRAQFEEALDSAVEFEKGLVDTAKTANLTEEEIEKLSKNVIGLSKALPASTKELLSISTAAGQLGVKGVSNLTKFAETIAKLGRVSDVEGNEAATTITRILNVTGEGIDTIDTFASGIVALGNNFAATESEIIRVTNEVARATTQFGLSSGQVAALSATLRSFGVRAEEAGTVIGKSFRAIQTSIDEGGKKLQQLERITGLTGEELRKQFGENAVVVFQRFLQGTKLLNEEGAILSREFEKIGLTGERVQKVIPTLSDNYDELARAIETFNKGAKDANALNEEFGRSAETTASQLQLLDNALSRLQVRIGDKFAAALEKVAPLLISVIDAIGEDATTAFANSTEDVGALRDQLDGLNLKLEAVKNNTLSLKDGGIIESPEEIEASIAKIKERIAELDTTQAQQNVKDLGAEIKALEEIGDTSSPLLDSVYGTPEERSARLQTLKEQLGNVRQLHVQHNQQIVEAEEEKNSGVREKRKEHFDVLAELGIENAEQQREFRTELQALKDEEQLELDEIDFARLEEKLGREQAIRQIAAINEIDDDKKKRAALTKLRVKADKQEKESLIKITKFQNLTQKQRVDAQRATLQTLANLNAGGNSALFAVSKAASLSVAGINVAEGVTKAFALGPILGPIAAAAIGAAGAIQIAKIAGAKPPPSSAGSFQEGGLITGTSQVNDRLTAQVNAGETILNRRQTDTVFRAINDGNIGGGGITVNIEAGIGGVSEEQVDNLIDAINDRTEFGNKELLSSEVA